MFQFDEIPTASGHVFRREGRKGPVWYAKYRLPDRRQVQKRIGPAWTGRGRPEPGTYNKRTAEAWLREVLREAEAGTLPGSVRTGATFADAAREWLRYLEEDRAVKPTTLTDCRNSVDNRFIPVFGHRRVEDITGREIEAWRNSMTTSARTRNKLLIQLNGIFKRARRVYGLRVNPCDDVEKLREPRYSDLEVFSPEEILALVRAAEDEQDAAIFLTAAFTGLRLGELLALRWRDVDFAGWTIRVRASYSGGHLTTPKSGKVRAVPLAPNVASALARLAQNRRRASDEDLVFPGVFGEYLCGNALRKRYKKALRDAGLRQLRFHDLRHTFGTRMIGKADIMRVKEWMGHAYVQTTMRYLHFVPRPEDAQLVAEAFATPATAPWPPPALAAA